MKKHHSILIACILAAAFVASRADDKAANNSSDKQIKPMENAKVIKTDEEWRKKLTPEQYAVTRHAATESPFGEAYEKFNAQGEGTYYCVACGAELFTSSEKFHSGCGWPSFYDASKAKNVLERVDDSHGMRRIETVCKRCDSHLGHVFEKEGYKTPTDRRFCINAAALLFVPKGGEPPKLEPVTSLKVQDKKAELKKAAGE
jgi:peptide-methionine (R)-S-oxide reductase